MYLAERVFIVLSLLYFAGGVTPSDLAENQHSQAINHANSLLQLIVFPCLLALFVVHWKKLSRKIYAFALPFVFTAVSLCSVAWSPSPGFSLRRCIIMLGFTIFSLYVGSRFTLPEQIDIFGWMAVVMVLASYSLGVFKPEWALSTGNHWGNWKGVFGHKNTLGRMALFGAVVLITGRPPGVPKVLRILASCGAVGLIALSGSATSVMAAAVLAAIWPLCPILRQRRPNTPPLWMALMPLATFITISVLTNFGLILRALGRDPTLTGRTGLWTAIINVAAKRPVLGFGYAAFWHYNGPERAALFSQVGWTPPHAHNAYLDMWLDMGYVGVSLLVILIVTVFLKSVKLYRISPSSRAGFPLMFLFFLVVVNCTESDLFRTHSFLWGPLISLYTSLKLLEDQQCKASNPVEREPAATVSGGASLAFS